MADQLPLDDFLLDVVKNGMLDSSSSSSSSSSSDSDSSSSSGSDDGYQFHDRRLLREMPTMRETKFRRLFGMCRSTFEALVDDTQDELPMGNTQTLITLMAVLHTRWRFLL